MGLTNLLLVLPRPRGTCITQHYSVSAPLQVLSIFTSSRVAISNRGTGLVAGFRRAEMSANQGVVSTQPLQFLAQTSELTFRTK